MEPVPKNTLPAIMYAVCAIRRGGNDVCAVFASDHIIERPDVLASTILQTQALARQGFVTFGIVPTEPETGYGYIKPGPKVPGGMEVSEFKEKPDLPKNTVPMAIFGTVVSLCLKPDSLLRR